MRKIVNVKGDLFATTCCFAAQAVIRLGSSLVLTRILRPDAYGIITIMISISFVVALLADMNVTLFIIRDPKAEQARYLNTAWTLQLARAALNTVVLFSCAPIVATSIYHLPSLVSPLRVFSLYFLFGGLQSMSFPLAIRRKQARIVMFSELASMFISTVFSVLLCFHFRNYWGMVLGMLLNQVLMSALSYLFFKEFRPMFELDMSAAREILRFTKFVMPSSLLTLSLSQFDKIVLLRLFGLQELGVYGLAGNIAGSVEALISKVSQTVLYPRCAYNFRTNESTFAFKYYSENIKLFTSMLILPAIVAGSAQLIVALLYPSRYAEAGAVLQALMLRAVLLALSSPAEDMLIAAGENQVIFLGNVFRALGLVTTSLVGYFYAGFIGFVYGVSLSGLPPLVYYWRLQRRKGLLMVKYEMMKIVFLLASVLLFHFLSQFVLSNFRGLHPVT